MNVPSRPPVSRRVLWVVALLLVSVAATRGYAADQFTPAQRAEIVRILREAMRDDPTILREAVAAVQDADTRTQQAAAHAAIASQRDALFNAADPVAGNPHGAVTIVEFFDTRCPYCRRMEPVMSQLLTQSPDVRLVYKDLPILGPPSVLGSRALLAAQQQGSYEKLRDAVMRSPPDLTKDALRTMVLQAGLDWPRLEHDMDDPAVQQRLDANVRLARALGIEGTPALVIGNNLIPGAVDLAELQKAVATARTQ
jgi:protein-disulfide isomerase